MENTIIIIEEMLDIDANGEIRFPELTEEQIKEIQNKFKNANK